MNHLLSNNGKDFRKSDIVYTPSLIAKEIIDRYAPSGRILDPCRGGGAFSSQISGCLWCEIRDGRNFFDFMDPVDWIISNPPYSCLNKWLEHSFRLASDVVYLLPIAKIFGSRKRMLLIDSYGGIVDI